MVHLQKFHQQFIVDAGGVIRHTQVGFDQGDEKKYEEVIKQVLKLK